MPTRQNKSSSVQLLTAYTRNNVYQKITKIGCVLVFVLASAQAQTSLPVTMDQGSTRATMTTEPPTQPITTTTLPPTTTTSTPLYPTTTDRPTNAESSAFVFTTKYSTPRLPMTTEQTSFVPHPTKVETSTISGLPLSTVAVSSSDWTASATTQTIYDYRPAPHERDVFLFVAAVIGICHFVGHLLYRTVVFACFRLKGFRLLRRARHLARLARSEHERVHDQHCTEGDRQWLRHLLDLSEQSLVHPRPLLAYLASALPCKCQMTSILAILEFIDGWRRIRHPRRWWKRRNLYAKVVTDFAVRLQWLYHLSGGQMDHNTAIMRWTVFPGMEQGAQVGTEYYDAGQGVRFNSHQQAPNPPTLPGYFHQPIEEGVMEMMAPFQGEVCAVCKDLTEDLGLAYSLAFLGKKVNIDLIRGILRRCGTACACSWRYVMLHLYETFERELTRNIGENPMLKTESDALKVQILDIEYALRAWHTTTKRPGTEEVAKWLSDRLDQEEQNVAAATAAMQKLSVKRCAGCSDCKRWKQDISVFNGLIKQAQQTVELMAHKDEAQARDVLATVIKRYGGAVTYFRQLLHDHGCPPEMMGPPTRSGLFSINHNADERLLDAFGNLQTVLTDPINDLKATLGDVRGAASGLQDFFKDLQTDNGLLASLKGAADTVKGRINALPEMANTASKGLLVSTILVQVVVLIQTRNKWLLFSILPQLVMLFDYGGKLPEIERSLTDLLNSDANDENGECTMAGPGDWFKPSLITGVILLVVAGVTDKTSYKAVADALPKDFRTISSIGALLQALPTMVPRVVKEYLARCVPGLVKLAYHEDEECMKAIGQVMHWSCDHNLQRFTTSSAAAHIERYYKIIRTHWLRQVKAGGVVSPTLFQVLLRASKLVARKQRVTNRHRVEPFVISFFGAPGCGKSFVSQVTALQLMPPQFFDSVEKQLGESDAAYRTRRAKTLLDQHVYSRNTGVKYWDSYNGEFCVLFDDLGQTDTDSTKVEGDDYVELLQIVGSNPLMLPFADLSEKGAYFTSKLVIANTNTSHPTPKGTVSAEAVRRRRHMLVRLERKKGMEDRSINRGDCSNYVFTLLDPLSPTKAPLMKFSGETSGEDFFRYAQAQFRRHQEIGAADAEHLASVVPVRTANPREIQEQAHLQAVQEYEEILRRQAEEAEALGEVRQMTGPDTDTDDYETPEDEVGLSFDKLLQQRGIQSNLDTIARFGLGTDSCGVHMENNAFPSLGLDRPQRRHSADLGSVPVERQPTKCVLNVRTSAVEYPHYREAFDALGPDDDVLRNMADEKMRYFARLNRFFARHPNVAFALKVLAVAAPLLVLGAYFYRKREEKAASERLPITDFDRTVHEMTGPEFEGIAGKLFAYSPSIARAFRYMYMQTIGRYYLGEMAAIGEAIGKGDIGLVTGNAAMQKAMRKYEIFDDDDDDDSSSDGDSPNPVMQKAYDGGRARRLAKQVKRQNRQRRHVMAGPDPAVMQAVQADRSLQTKCARNFTTITMSCKVGAFTGVGVAGHWMLVPKHYFEDDNAQIIQEQFDFEIKRCGMTFRQIYTPDRLVLHPTSELALYKISENAPEFADIRRQLCDWRKCSTRTSWPVTVLYHEATEQAAFQRSRANWTGKEGCGVLTSSRPSPLRKFNPEGLWECPLPAVRGDCGSLLLAESNKLDQKIVGLLVAGDNRSILSAGFDTPWLRRITGLAIDDDFVRVMQAPSSRGEEVPDEKCFPIPTGNYLVLAPTRPVRMATETELTKSLVHGCVPVTKEPAVLSDKDPRLEVKVSPLREGIAGFGVVLPAIETWKLEATTDWLAQRFERHYGVEYKKTFPLEHIFEGDEFLEGHDRMNLHSSCGYPWGLDKPTNGKGKTWLFHKDENGDVDLNRLNEHGRRIMQEARNALALMRRGIKPPLFYTGLLKDELRATEKVKKGNTRFFMGADVVQSMIFRHLFGGINAAMKVGGFRTGIAVGIDPHSEWTALYNYMTELNPRCYAADYKNWDRRVPPQFFYAICDAVNRWYDDGEENAVARRVLISLTVHSNVVIQNVVVRKTCGMPSGFGGTDTWNSLAQMCVLAHRWLTLAPAHLRTLETLDEYNRYVFYGDDSLISADTSIRDWWNGGAFMLHDSMLLQLIVTSEKKDSPDLVEEFIEDVTFLKRGFRPEARVVMCPLNKDSIYGMINWTTKTLLPEDATELNCKVALQEAVYHGKDFYVELRNKIEKAAKQVALTCIFPSYIEMKQQALERLSIIPKPRVMMGPPGPNDVEEKVAGGVWRWDKNGNKNDGEFIADAAAPEVVTAPAPTTMATGNIVWDEKPAQAVVSKDQGSMAEVISDEPWTFESAMKRKFVVANPAIDTTMTIGHTVIALDVPSELTMLPSIHAVLRQVTYARLGVRLSIRVDNNPFFAGMLIAAFVPIVASPVESYSINSMMRIDHKIIDLSTAKDITFDIPHQTWSYALNTDFTGANWVGEAATYGTFLVKIFLPLRYPNSTNIIIAAEFTEVNTSALRVTPLTREDKHTEGELYPIAPFVSARTRAAVQTERGVVPVFGGVEMMGSSNSKTVVNNNTINVQGNAGNLHGVDQDSHDTNSASTSVDAKADLDATIPPMDNPAFDNVYLPTFRVPQQYLTATSGTYFHGAKMCFELGEERFVNTDNLGTSRDDMQLKAMMQVPGILTQFEWKQTDPRGHIIWQAPITPSVSQLMLKGPSNVYGIPQEVPLVISLSLLRRVWRGSLRYGMYIASDGFARGHLAFVVVYGRFAEFPADMAFYDMSNQNIHHMALDDQTRHHTFDVAYRFPDHVRPLHQDNEVSTININNVSTGRIALIVVNPLTGTTQTSVNGYITMGAGEDYEVSGLTSMLAFTPQYYPRTSGTLMQGGGAFGEGEASTVVAGSTKAPKPIGVGKTSPLGMERELTHVSHFCKRMQSIGKFKLRGIQSSEATLTAPLYELYIPVTAGIYGSGTVHRPLTLFDWFSRFYLGYVGDMRYRIRCLEGKPFEVRYSEEPLGSLVSAQSQNPSYWVGALTGVTRPSYLPCIQSDGEEVCITVVNRNEASFLLTPTALRLSTGAPTSYGLPLWYDVGGALQNNLTSYANRANNRYVMGVVIVSAAEAVTIDVQRAPNDAFRFVRNIVVPPVQAELPTGGNRFWTDVPRMTGGKKAVTVVTREHRDGVIKLLRGGMNTPYVVLSSIETPQLTVVYDDTTSVDPGTLDNKGWTSYNTTDLTAADMKALKNGVLNGTNYQSAGSWDGFSATTVGGDLAIADGTSVDIGNFPDKTTVEGSVTVSGTVGVNNFPATTSVTGTVAVNNFPSSTSIGNLPTQDVGNLGPFLKCLVSEYPNSSLVVGDSILRANSATFMDTLGGRTSVNDNTLMSRLRDIVTAMDMGNDHWTAYQADFGHRHDDGTQPTLLGLTYSTRQLTGECRDLLSSIRNILQQHWGIGTQQQSQSSTLLRSRSATRLDQAQEDPDVDQPSAASLGRKPETLRREKYLRRSMKRYD